MCHNIFKRKIFLVLFPDCMVIMIEMYFLIVRERYYPFSNQAFSFRIWVLHWCVCRRVRGRLYNNSSIFQWLSGKKILPGLSQERNEPDAEEGIVMWKRLVLGIKKRSSLTRKKEGS